MAEQRITTKPTVNALLDEDYIFINHDGALRQIRKSNADIASGADLAEMAASLEQFEESVSGQIDAYAIINTANGSIASFSDGADNLQMKSLKVSIIPKQDMHGYDHPWIGGTGKNLLDTSGMSTAGQNQATFTRDADGTIHVGGKAVSTVYRVVGSVQTQEGVRYTLTGTPSGGGNGKYRMTMAGFGYDYGSGYTFTGDGNAHNVSVDIFTGYPQSGTLEFKPMVRLASIEDSTYEPYENICPIEGWTDVNVNVESANIIKTPYIGGASSYGVNFTKNDDGSVHVAGTPTRTLSWIFDNSIKLKGGARYTFGYFGDMPNMNEWRLQIYSPQTATLYGFIRKSSPTLVIEPTKDDTVSVYFDTSSGAVDRAVDFTVQPVLVHGEMPAAYALYNGHTTPVPLGQTVYGGEVNPISGELKITDVCLTLTGEESGWANAGNTSFYNMSLMVNALAPSGSIKDVKGICSHDATNSSGYLNSYIRKGETYGGLQFYDTANYWGISGTDLASKLNYLKAQYTNGTPVQIKYELATPTTVQLTPTQVATLLGTNNVWSDAGDVEVSYTANPKIYIDNKFAELQALILENN